MKRTSLQKFLQKSHALLDGLYGSSVTIEGQQIRAIVSAQREGGSFGLGGETPSGSLVLKVKRGLLPSPPKHGETVLTYRGRKWRVSDTADAEIEEWVYLSCVPENA